MMDLLRKHPHRFCPGSVIDLLPEQVGVVDEMLLEIDNVRTAGHYMIRAIFVDERGGLEVMDNRHLMSDAEARDAIAAILAHAADRASKLNEMKKER